MNRDTVLDRRTSLLSSRECPAQREDSPKGDSDSRLCRLCHGVGLTASVACPTGRQGHRPASRGYSLQHSCTPVFTCLRVSKVASRTPAAPFSGGEMGRWRAAVNYLSTQPPVSQPWAVATPSNVFLLELLLAISLISIVATVAFKRLKRPGMFIKACGVRARKVQRTMQEIERKTFHLATLLVPIIHQLLLWSGDWTNDECVKLCWVITAAGWTADLARVHGPPWARRLFPLKRLLRESEKNRITGGCYLSLGCTLTMAISPPSITLTSILFLVLGDMSAALIGVSFGGETVGLKLGRHGKKSAEGSAAMLVVCFVVGCVVFGGVELREYPVAIGAPAIHIHGTHTGQRQGGRTSSPPPPPPPGAQSQQRASPR